IIFSNFTNEISGGVNLTKSKLVMVFMVENVKKITIERMDVIKSVELFDDGGELLVKVGLCELHFSL
ncbi:hypothetical protein Tco_0384128, partial [Tanacetum coccineum]